MVTYMYCRSKLNKFLTRGSRSQQIKKITSNLACSRSQEIKKTMSNLACKLNALSKKWSLQQGSTLTLTRSPLETKISSVESCKKVNWPNILARSGKWLSTVWKEVVGDRKLNDTKSCYNKKKSFSENQECANQVSTKSACVRPGIVRSFVFMARCAFICFQSTAGAISMSFCSICALAVELCQGIKNEQTKNSQRKQKNMKEKEYDWKWILKRVSDYAKQNICFLQF